MTLKIEYSRKASQTPAFALLAEGWNEIVQSGFTPDLVGVCPVTADTEVLYAISTEGDLVGVLAWDGSTPDGKYRVTMAYVEPSSRRKGVFHALLTTLKQKARQDSPVNGVGTIISIIGEQNTIAKLAFAREQGQPVCSIYEHLV